MWSKSVVEMTKQGFPKKQDVLTHDRMCLLLSKGHFCHRPRRAGERKRKSVQGCIVNADLRILNLVIVKKERRLFQYWQVPLYHDGWGSKELAKSANISVSLRKMMSDNMSSESPWAKKIRSPGLKHPGVSVLLHPMSCNTNKAPRKIRGRLQNMLNCWPREWEKPKKSARNRLPRNAGCPHWELLLPSLSLAKKNL